MSFYMLSLVINSGAAWSRDDHYIYNNFQEIRRKLYDYLTSNIGCYEAVWIGIDIYLKVYENYHLKSQIDLHPYITYELDQYPCIYYDGNNDPMVAKMDDSILTKDDPEFDEYFCVKVLNGDENIKVNLNFPRIENLNGKLIEKDDIFNLDDYPNHQFHYGRNDLDMDNQNISDSEMTIADGETSADDMSVSCFSDDEGKNL